MEKNFYPKFNSANIVFAYPVSLNRAAASQARQEESIFSQVQSVLVNGWTFFF